MGPETGTRYSFLNKETRHIRGPFCTDCLNGKYKDMLLKLETDRILRLYEHQAQQTLFRCFRNLIHKNGPSKPFVNGHSTGLSLSCADTDCHSPFAPPAYMVSSAVQTDIKGLRSSQPGLYHQQHRKDDSDDCKKLQVMLPFTDQRYSYLNWRTLDMCGPFCAKCMNELFLVEIRQLRSTNDVLIIEQLPNGCRTRPLMSFQMENTVDPIDRPFMPRTTSNYYLPCVSVKCLPVKVQTPYNNLLDPESCQACVQADLPITEVKYGFGLDTLAMEKLHRKAAAIRKQERMDQLKKREAEFKKNGPSVPASTLAMMRSTFRRH